MRCCCNDLPRSAGFPSHARSAGRTCSTTGTPSYAGDVGIGIRPGLAQRVREADVLLVIGERLGEMTTSGYTLLDVPAPRQTLIHVHPGSRGARPRLSTSASDLRDTWRVPRRGRNAPARGLRNVGARRRPRCMREYEAWREPRPVPGALDLWRIVRWLDERLPDDAILTNGAGQLHDLDPSTLSLPAPGHAARAVLRRDGLRRAERRGSEARAPGADRRVLERRRLLPDERPGARNRGAVRRWPSSSSSSTTRCTARSACTRSAPTRVACPAPISSIRISPRSPARTARTAETVERTDEFAPAFERALASGGRCVAACQARSAGADDERVARCDTRERETKGDRRGPRKVTERFDGG